MDNTVIIERNGKRVEGAVKEIDNHVVRWSRKAFASTSYFYAEDGWREVPKPKWVPVKCDYNAGKLVVTLSEYLQYSYRLPDGYRWKTVVIEREVEG